MLSTLHSRSDHPCLTRQGRDSQTGRMHTAGIGGHWTRTGHWWSEYCHPPPQQAPGFCGQNSTNKIASSGRAALHASSPRRARLPIGPRCAPSGRVVPRRAGCPSGGVCPVGPSCVPSGRLPIGPSFAPSGLAGGHRAARTCWRPSARVMLEAIGPRDAGGHRAARTGGHRAART
jgi:hypothetical protein